jgi:hypothetical protein
MGMVIEGAGTGGYKVDVDSTGKMQTRSVTENENQWSTEIGDGYNINTGTIALTSSTESGVLYFKNNENKVFIVEAVAVGIGSAGTVTDSSIITLVRNPTSGTLISGATAVDMNQNRNFGSSNTLSDSLAYKGAEGSTVTDGDDALLFYQSAGGRLFASIGLELKKGNSIAIKIDTNTSSGTTNVYAAIVGHLKDETLIAG